MEKNTLFIIGLIFCIFYAGCGGRMKRMPNPVLSYIPGDETLNCEQLKAEMAKIKRDIAIFVPLAKARAKDPNNIEKRSRKAEKIEIEALNARYSSLLLLAYKHEGCIANGSTEGIGKDDMPLMCSICGPVISKEWHNLNNQLVCDKCFKKRQGR